MDVFFCTDGIFPHAVGGMQRHSRLLIEALAKNAQLQLKVIHPHEGQKIFSAFPNVEEFIIPPLPGKKQYLLECYHYSANVAEILQRESSGVIYSQGLSVWKDVDEFEDRLIVNPHGLESFQAIGLRNRITAMPFRLVFGYIMKRARYVVALGGKLTDILTRLYGAEKVIVLPNAVNLPSTPKLKQGNLSLRILFVGRFSYNKGIHILLKAAERLNKLGYENIVAFDLIGTGPLFNQYRSTCDLLNVNFLGGLTDAELFAAYETCDVLVLPTLYEGMPTVVLEAMSYATPIIVTDVGATRELVGPDNGYIINKNDVTSLVSALIHFCNMSESDRLKLARCSRQKVKERFTWDSVSAKHMKLFESLIRGDSVRTLASKKYHSDQ